MKIKRYKEYKDSGVEWLGEIPGHWEKIRIKHIFKDHSEKNHPEAELLSVTQTQGVVPRSLVENRMVMPSGNLETFKYIQKGDFAISLRSFEGGLEYSEYDGIISPAYTVLKLKRKVDRGYLKHLLKSYSFISELQTSVIGIREGKNISFPELSYSFLPIPPLQEQQQIVSCLDEKTPQIDKTITQKEQIIELLKERKQIIINQAVTKGLDPNIALKDSGVDWIGEIPKHWEVKKLRHMVHMIVSNVDKHSKKLEKPVKLCNYVDVYKNDFIDEKLNFMEATATQDEIERYKIKKGDVIITKDSESWLDIGIPALVKHEEEFFICAYHLAILRSLNIYGGYLFRALQSISAKTQFSIQANGVTRCGLSHNAILDVYIPFPISSQEQIQISDYIEQNIQKIDLAISQKQQEIEKLKEYKSVLIDNAVTGKICLTDN